MISVVMPTYNRGRLMEKAALSVLGQSVKEIELIVVDDGSSDNTADVVKSLKDPRVKYVFQKNSGACVARNNGVDHADGEYIAFHDSDDIWHADKLEKQMAALQKFDADVVFCRMDKVVNGQKVDTIGKLFQEGLLDPRMLPLAIGTQTLLGKSSVFKEERFDPEMPRFQEFEMLVRIQKKFKICGMAESLVDYVLQDDSISMNPDKFLLAWKLMLQKHPDFLTVYATSRDRIAYDVLKNAFSVENKGSRAKMIALAFYFKKSPRMLWRLFKFWANRNA